MSEKTLSFERLREANISLVEEVFHPIAEWSPTDWACAAAGEMGEACNLVKKMRRNMVTVESYPLQFREAILEELADTVIYLDLLAERLGLSLADAVRKKFDHVAAKNGSKVRL